MSNLEADSQFFAAKLAQRLFEKRGNHSEAHLTKAELAAIIAFAIECWEKRKTK